MNETKYSRAVFREAVPNPRKKEKGAVDEYRKNSLYL